MAPVDASQTLFQYGAVGAIAAVLLALFVWTFRLVLMRFLTAWDTIAKNLVSVQTNQATTAIESTGRHQQIMLTLTNQHTASMKEIEVIRQGQQHRRPNT